MWDVLIIGGGPAGLTAGLYASRAGMKALLIERAFAGGQAATTNVIENYPGFPGGTGGPELCIQMRKQAELAGLTINYSDITRFELSGELKSVFGADGKEETGRAAILCMGSTPRKLNVMGEERLVGRGVSYCATCDGAFYRDKSVAVVGGGDTAVEDALYLSQFATSVRLIHRRDELRATPYLAGRVLENKRITPIWDTVVLEIAGENQVMGLSVENVKTGKRELISADGVFIAVGTQPQTGLLTDIELEGGYVRTNEACETNLKGVFAAGDIRVKPLRQVITAAADGAIAATQAFRYLS